MLLRMSERDRETYGGPEWLDTTATEDALNDLDYDALNAIDTEIFNTIGIGLIRLLGGRLATWKLDATRVRLWLALRHAGVKIPLVDFKPRDLLNGLDLKVGDADPPSSEPDSSGTSTSATTPESATSGSASTPGQRGRSTSSPRK